MTYCAVLVACMLARVAAAEPPPIADAIAHAAQTGKALVVELTAEWCPPCRYFEENVLPKSAVVAALEDIEFVQYDIDTPVGEAVAEKYRTPGVPTFLVIADDGSEVARQVGLGDTKLAEKMFVDLLARARAPHTTIAQLEAAAAAHPEDVASQLALAKHYRAAGRIDDAIEHYRAVVATPAASRENAASAAIAIDELATAAARVQIAVQAAEAFVEKFPDSPAASYKLAIIALSGRVAPERVHALLATHLGAVAKTDLPNAVRVALLIGANDEANAAIRNWLATAPGLADVRLLDAEASLYHGDRRSAMQGLRDACASRPPGLEAWCYSLADAVKRNRRSPAIQHLRSIAEAYLRDLETPGEPSGFADLAQLAALDRELGNAIVRLIVAAQARCEGVEHVDSYATVMFTLSAKGGAPTDVQVYAQRDHAISSCLHDELAHRALPPPSDGERRVVVPVDLGRHNHVNWASSAAIASGAFIGLAWRTGAVHTTGLATAGVVDVHRAADFRLVAGWQAEYGSNASDNTSSWLVRGLAGFGYAPSPGAAFSLTMGVGASRLGAMIPRAGEFPIEARLRLTWRDIRFQLFLCSIRVFDQPARQPISSGDPFDGDEYAFGFAYSARVFGQRLFGAAAFEHRPAGSTTVLALGLPLAGY